MRILTAIFLAILSFAIILAILSILIKKFFPNPKLKSNPSIFDETDLIRVCTQRAIQEPWKNLDTKVAVFYTADYLVKQISAHLAAINRVTFAILAAVASILTAIIANIISSSIKIENILK